MIHRQIMKIYVKYFASVRDIMGKDSEDHKQLFILKIKLRGLIN